jgi:hypothetical protein
MNKMLKRFEFLLENPDIKFSKTLCLKDIIRIMIRKMSAKNVIT